MRLLSAAIAASLDWPIGRSCGRHPAVASVRASYSSSEPGVNHRGSGLEPACVRHVRGRFDGASLAHHRLAGRPGERFECPFPLLRVSSAA